MINCKKLTSLTIWLSSILFSCINSNSYPEKSNEPVKFIRSAISLNQLKDSLNNLDFYNAMSVAIIRPDTMTIWNFGQANDSTLYRVGSLSKSFAGLSILKLVEEGKLSLNDTLIKLIPELPFTNKFAEPVLLKHVLEASAGFIGYRKEDFVPDPNVTPIKEALLNNPYDLEPKWTPGTFTTYHNLGPFISSYIVETKSKMAYRDYVQKYLFNPLEMPRSTYLINEDVRKYLVNFNDSTYFHIKPRPAGALNTSTIEFAHFLKMLINDGNYQSQQIISKESIDRFEISTSNMAVNQLGIKDGHGINNWAMYFDGVTYHSHGGLIPPKYLAYYGYSREYGTGFVFMLEGSLKKEYIKIINRLVLPYLHPKIEKWQINEISEGQENGFLGCYEQIQISHLHDPAFQIKLVRDSIGQLAILDNNFEYPPFIKSLKPTNVKYIYLDDDPKNNFSLSGQTRYALLINENGERIIQKISYPWEAYKLISCEEKVAVRP